MSRRQMQGSLLVALVAAATGIAVVSAPAAAQTISSGANQVFVVNDPSTVISAVTITDAVVPVITAKNDIRIHIPATFNMLFDATVTTVTITGTGSLKMSTTLKAYEDGGRTAVLDVSTNFAASNQIVVTGLKFTTFSATSATSNLWLEVGNNGATTATDDKTIQITAPTLAGAANQVFTVGDPATAITTTTITESAAPRITAANDIRLRIPAALNMVWNTAITTATIGGGALGKVSTAVTYEDAGKTLVINVTTSFAAGDQITVSGLQFQSFTAISSATSLQLVIAGSGGATIATGSTTNQIVQPSIVSGANQAFPVGAAATNMSMIVITDNATAGSINTVNKLRVRIPSGFNMTWNTALTTATIGGGAAAKVSPTVTYEDASRTLVLTVTTNFVANDQITVSGLQYQGFTALSPLNNLQLVISGSGGNTAATDTKTIQVYVPLAISSAASQTFVVNDAATTASTITITDALVATMTAANDIRVRIPAALGMTWDATVTTATITGTGSGKVSTTVSYANGNKDLVINVTTNFASNDQIVVSGLNFTNFTAASAANNLGMITAGSGGSVVANDDKTITISAVTLTGTANQQFSVGDAATAMTPTTVTDASIPKITAANDIRIRVPTGFNMTWNTALTTATISGTGSGKVSTAVTYENSGQVLVVNVTSDFAANDAITISGLQFMNFTAASAAAPLQLVISGSAGGTTFAVSDKTKQVFALTISSAANQIYNVGMGAHNASTITITGDASGQINTTNGLRIRIPAALSMTWNTAITTATIGGSAAAKVSTTVSYGTSNLTLILTVLTNFSPGDQITISGVQFANFTAVSAANNLTLGTGGAGSPTAATDDKTIAIVATYGISSAANQVFNVGQAATLISPITVTDSGTTATITAKNDILIIIPAALSMIWDNTVTTLTITGTGASKVSTTPVYPAGNLTLSLNVTTNFAPGDQIVVSGAKFKTFSAGSGPSSLQEKVGGSGAAVVSTDDKTIVIYQRGVSVTPATSTASKLPSNGTNYTVAFTVQNTGGATDDFDLLTVRNPGTTLTTISITGSGITQGGLPDSARLTGLAAAASVAATVTYSVANVAAGSVDTLRFTARSLSDVSKTSLGKLTVTVIRPNMTTSRSVLPTGAQPPGTLITHTITITNTGSTDASTVILSDSISTNLQFKLGSVVTNMPGGISVALEYSNDLGVTWTYTPVSAGCSAPAGYDACVNRIRWRLLSPLSSTGPNNTGNVQFISRIR